MVLISGRSFGNPAAAGQFGDCLSDGLHNLFEVHGHKYVYVGLTGHLAKRDKEHRTKARSSVNKFALLHKVDIPSVQQVTNYLPKEEAAQKEGEVLK